MRAAEPTTSFVVNRFVVLTDIAGSSRLAETYPHEYSACLERHNTLIERVVVARGGEVYKHTGDGYIALFETASACVEAVLDLGTAFAAFPLLGGTEPFLVRIALHGGELRESGGEYHGPVLNRASRICQVISSGQAVLSAAVRAVLGGRLPAGATLTDLGEHHLRDLAEPEHLYQLDHPDFAQHEFPPLATLNNRPNNLLRQPNHFIGRETELAELTGLLSHDTTLLTLVAPGGYGKSRLAVQLCAHLLHSFEHGAYVAYLAPLRGVTDVPHGIAGALSFQFTTGRTPEQQLCDYLRAKELLLCLDNFEHVIGASPLIAELLRAAPRLKVVITSREPLRMESERIYRLEPLPIAAAKSEQYSDAERLFADRAALVNSSFALTADNALLVKQICRQLSGIPLAIELAGAWMDGFTLCEMKDQLSSALELEARTSDTPARHHSLRASLGWSWNLLGAQKDVLMRISVFRGGFFSDAGGAVLGLTGMALRSALLKLCDKSWLYTREIAGQMRFYLRDMLALEYAREKLEETRLSEDSLEQQARNAHAAYFIALLAKEGPRLRGDGTDDGQMDALRRLKLEMQNILQAFDTALQSDALDWLLPLAEHLWRYFEMTSRLMELRERYGLLLEASQRLGSLELELHARLRLSIAAERTGSFAEAEQQASAAEALAVSLNLPKFQAAALQLAGQTHWQRGTYAEAHRLLSEAAQIFASVGDRYGEAGALHLLALVDQSQCSYISARERYGRALAIRRELGDRHGAAGTLNNLGMVERNQGNYSAASELYLQALEINRATGNRLWEANNLNNLANMEYDLGQHGSAAEMLIQARTIYRELGNRHGEAYASHGLGTIEYDLGNYSTAHEQYMHALEIERVLGDRRGEALSLNGLGNVAISQGHASAALDLDSQALAIYRELGNRQGEAHVLRSLGAVQACQANYDAARELLSQSLALARELGDRKGEGYSMVSLGNAEYCQEHYHAAKQLYGQAIDIFHELGDRYGVVLACSTCGSALAGQEMLQQAALILFGMQQMLRETKYQFEPDGRQVINSGQALLESAVADSRLPAAELAELKAQAETLSLDMLVEFARQALADHGSLTAYECAGD